MPMQILWFVNRNEALPSGPRRMYIVPEVFNFRTSCVKKNGKLPWNDFPCSRKNH